MVGKRGFYEILMAFFTIVILVSAVVFFMYVNNASSMIFAQVKQTAQTPSEASQVKDALLSCHQVDYLEESKFDNPCKADNLLKGYRVVQLPLNGCAEKIWDHSRGQYSQAIPYIVSVQQADVGRRCLARLEVFA